MESKEDVMYEKQKVREALLQAECERLRTHVKDGESRYTREAEWFHQQVEESRRLSEERVKEKDKEIEELKLQIQVLRDEVEKQFSHALENVHSIESVRELQETLLKKRSAFEAEAMSREERFSKEKQDWLKEMQVMKARTGEVLKQFEEEYVQKRTQLENEHRQEADEHAREKEIMAREKEELAAQQDRVKKREEDVEKKLADMEKKLQTQMQKPVFDPPYGTGMPLVRESLLEPIFPLFTEAISRQVLFCLDEFGAMLPEAHHQDFHLLKERIQRQFNDLKLSVEPFQAALQPSSLTIILDETIKNFESVCAERKIDIKKQYQDSIPHLFIDPKKTLYAFSSIMQNDVDAMPGGGPLSITVAHDKKNMKVKAVFESRGAGVSRDNSTKLFDPFFTTKDGHCGLGLTSARYIVHAMNADILAESQMGSGIQITCIFSVKN